MQFCCGKKNGLDGRKNQGVGEEKWGVGPLLHFPRTSRHAIFFVICLRTVTSAGALVGEMSQLELD